MDTNHLNRRNSTQSDSHSETRACRYVYTPPIPWHQGSRWPSHCISYICDEWNQLLMKMWCFCNIITANFTLQAMVAPTSGLETWTYEDFAFARRGAGRLNTKKKIKRNHLYRPMRRRPYVAPRPCIRTQPACRVPRRSEAPRLFTASTASLRRPLPASSALAVPADATRANKKTKIQNPPKSAPDPKLSNGRIAGAEHAACTYSWRAGGRRRPPPGGAAAAARRDLHVVEGRRG